MPTVVLVGAQWGDEGKGKVTDYLSAEADMVVRYQGGSNAGHTVVVRGEEYRLHLVPSGVINGKACVIGNGVVLDPAIFLEEMDGLRARGVANGPVYVSDCAHVIFPYHKRLDAVEEERRGAGKLGTTGRGIGPAYMDKSARIGIRVADLLNERVLREKLGRNLEQVNHLLERVYDAEGFDFEEMFRSYRAYGERLAPYVTDTSRLVNEAIDAGQKVLFEGAQGTLLDIDHGTYPYVTSSHPTAGGACIGSGVGPTRIDRVIGVAKAYATRVGDGPFPTELSDETGRRLQEQGQEFGTTTGRPRRCGWLDLTILRYAVQVSGLTGLAITKLDTLTGLDPLRVCTGYEYEKRPLPGFPHDLEVLRGCTPVYEELPGWHEPISSVTDWDELPAAARAYVDFIAERTGVPVVLVSVGADRHHTLVREPVFPLTPRR